MSRYSETFHSHPFQARFKDLVRLVEETDLGDLSLTSSVSEIQRLKKVINYINQVLLSLDPELVPLTIWDNFLQQTSACYNEVSNYLSSLNIAYIQNANSYADNLLNYVRPYLLLKGKAKALVENIYSENQKQYELYLNNFHENVLEKISAIQLLESQSQQLHGEIQQLFNKIQSFNDILFGANSENLGIADQIKNSYSEIKKYDEEIEVFHSKLLEDTPKQDSIQTEILNTKSEITEEKAAVIKLVASVKDEVQELKDFYVSVFGEVDGNGGLVGGLSKEIDDKLEVLTNLEITNKTRYDAVVTELQSLLPGATSAGLATAYRQMKNSYSKPIKTFECLFYIAIGLLVFITGLSIFETVSVSRETWFSYKLASYATWNDAFKAILIKLPLYGALIWFAFFASKRRSEYQRLQQEYAHKEALAKSYGSYKKQIEALDSEDMALQKEFIAKMVDAIAFNASQTLDGNHGDQHPLHHVFEKLVGKLDGAISIDDLKSLLRIKT